MNNISKKLKIQWVAWMDILKKENTVVTIFDYSSLFSNPCGIKVLCFTKKSDCNWPQNFTLR